MAKEIEFVCSNPSVDGSTKPEHQEKLMRSLATVPGLHTYRQDFGDQTSLAAVIKHDAPSHTMQTVKRLAKRHGVNIDMVNDVDESHIDRIVTGGLEGITHYYSS